MRPFLTDDQEFFRATTARFLDELVPPAKLRRLRDDPNGFDVDYWRRGAELGWTSLLVAEQDGGGSISGEGLVDLTLVAHEFGMHASPGPLVPANLVAAALSDTGTHGDVLAAVLAGSSIVTWCGGAARFDSTGGVAIDVRDSDVVLDGRARPVESASAADQILVTGRTGDGLTQILVPTDTPGISIEPMHTVDLTRRFSVVRFDGVRLPVAAVVGDPAGAADMLERQSVLAMVLAAAESVGALQRAFDMTLEWSFDRYSFGRPLASYQAIKHRMADMKAWLEAGHGIADAAASAVSAGAPDAGELARAAKAFVGTYGSELMHECVQLHGGLGVTFEHDVHLFLRRHTLDRTLYGTPAEHRQEIAHIMARREDSAA